MNISAASVFVKKKHVLYHFDLHKIYFKFIYLWIQQNKKKKSRYWKYPTFLKADEKRTCPGHSERYLGLRRGEERVERGRQQEYKEHHPKQIKGQERLKN